MKKLILAAAMLCAVSAAVAQTIAPQYEDAVQVNGKSEKKISPDEIYVAITIKDGDTKNQTVEQLESRMKREFRDLGIDVESALKVAGMANAPKKRKDVDTRRSYELKVGVAGLLGDVFEVLGEMGVSDARVTRVSHSRINEFRREVRIEAVKNARANAEVLAQAVGQSIGPAVWILDNGYYESSPVLLKTRSYVALDAVSSTLADQGAGQGLDMQEITLNYDISAKFILNRN